MDYSLPGASFSSEGPSWNLYLSHGFALPDLTLSDYQYDNEVYYDRSHQTGLYHSDSAGYFPESDPLSQRSNSSKSSNHGSLNADPDDPSNHDDDSEGTDDRDSLNRETRYQRRSPSTASSYDSLVCGLYCCCCCCEDQTNVGKRARWLICFILKVSIVLGCFIVMVVLLIRYRPGKSS